MFVVNKVLFLRKPHVINYSPSYILHHLILWGEKSTMEMLVTIGATFN